MKAIATHRTYNPDDCTSAGFLFQLYPDGRLAATYHTRWQGSRTNERWITESGYLTLEDSLYSNHDDLLKAWIHEEASDLCLEDLEDDDRWKKVRNGYIVR